MTILMRYYRAGTKYVFSMYLLRLTVFKLINLLSELCQCVGTISL